MTAIGFSSSKTYNGQNTAKSTFISKSWTPTNIPRDQPLHFYYDRDNFSSP